MIAKRSAQCQTPGGRRFAARRRAPVRFGRSARGPAATVVALVLAAGAGSAAAPPESVEQGRRQFQAALAARGKQDYPAYRDAMREALRLRPNHPGYLQRLAGAEALTGHPEAALDLLDQVAGLGMVLDAPAEPDLEALKPLPRFGRIRERLERNARPAGRSADAFTVPETGFIAEGIAHDPATDTFFVGSVRRRKIVAVDRTTGKVRDFSAPADGLWGVFGMKVDAARRRLWVATAALPEMEGFRAEEAGQAAVVRYDLRSGKLAGRYRPETGGHLFGDLTVGPAGEVIVSDSAAPDLYRIAAGVDRLEPFLAGGPFVSLQGLDFSSDGRVLYVADYSQGIFAVDPETRRAELLPAPADVTLLGVDALLVHRGALVAVQNGTNPNRVIRLRLDRSGRRVERLEVMAANRPGLEAPTLGVLNGKNLYLVGNSEWDAFNPESGRPDTAKFRSPRILELPL